MQAISTYVSSLPVTAECDARVCTRRRACIQLSHPCALMLCTHHVSIDAVLSCSLQQLVYEKEKRLRMMMKMHGLGE